MRSSGSAPYIRVMPSRTITATSYAKAGSYARRLGKAVANSRLSTVAVLEAFALQCGASCRGAQQESTGAHVAGGPQQVREPMEAEHRVVDEEGEHGLAPGGVGGARGGEARHRARLGDAFFQDLTVGGFLVAEQEIGVDGFVALAAGCVDLVPSEQGVDTEGARLVGNDRHDARTEARIAQQVAQQPGERPGGRCGHLLPGAGSTAPGRRRRLAASSRRVSRAALGDDRPRLRRRSIRYSYSGESTPGWTYGGSSSVSAASVIGSSSRSRKVRSSASVIFLIWWVALRASTSGPSAQPFTVCARITVGAPR